MTPPRMRSKTDYQNKAWPPTTSADEALAGSPDRERTIALVRTALAHYEGEVVQTARTLAEADAELAEAQAAQAPLDSAWWLGQPEPGGGSPPALPPGHFRMPDGRPWPRLVAARQRTATAQETRRLTAAAHQLAQQQVAMRKGVLTRLETESTTTTIEETAV